MGKRKRMIDTSIPEREEETPSRNDRRVERRAEQERLATLVERLGLLSPEALEALELGDEVERGMEVIAGLTSGSALPRQRRRVAKLLRDADLDALEREVEIALGEREASPGETYRLERLRDGLLGEDGDEALHALLDANPTLDRQTILSAVRAARDEKAAGRSKRRFRALYQTLKELGLGEP